MGYLVNGSCYQTDIEAARQLCSSWHGTTEASNVTIQSCVGASIPSVGQALLKFQHWKLNPVNGLPIYSYNYSAGMVLIPCTYVAPVNSSTAYRATPEEYQAVTVIFSAVLAALCVVWGFRQIIKIFATHPEA